MIRARTANQSVSRATASLFSVEKLDMTYAVVSQPDRIVDVYNKEHRRRRICRLHYLDTGSKENISILPGRHASAPTKTLHRTTKMVAPAIILGLRGVQVVLSIIVMGLTAYRMSLVPQFQTSKLTLP
jgi:hypothetical protein